MQTRDSQIGGRGTTSRQGSRRVVQGRDTSSSTDAQQSTHCNSLGETRIFECAAGNYATALNFLTRRHLFCERGCQRLLSACEGRHPGLWGYFSFVSRNASPEVMSFPPCGWEKACVVARASVSGLSDVGRTYAELNARWRRCTRVRTRSCWGIPRPWRSECAARWYAPGRRASGV